MATLPVTMATARRIFIAFFICDYVLPLTVIGFISVSIFRHITVHGMSTAGQNANRCANSGDISVTIAHAPHVRFLVTQLTVVRQIYCKNLYKSTTNPRQIEPVEF